MVDHAWLIWWYRSWNCSDSVVLFVFLFDYGWSCMTYMVVQILELFRQCGVVCFSVWLWLIMHDLYGGTDLGFVQTVWCCLFFCFTMVYHAWLIWWYISWICSDCVVLFVFLFDYGLSCMTYMVVQILELFRQCGVVCFSVWLWLIMHDLYGGTDLGTVQKVWCCLFFCLTMVDHAWLIWWYISWICSDSVVLFACHFFLLNAFKRVSK
jgi:hypothetical protein